MPNRRNQDTIGVPVGSVWTKQTSSGPQRLVYTAAGNFAPAPTAEPGPWERFTGWVEAELPGGWWTVAGVAGVAAYLLFSPPRPRKRTVVAVPIAESSRADHRQKKAGR